MCTSILILEMRASEATDALHMDVRGWEWVENVLWAFEKLLT